MQDYWSIDETFVCGVTTVTSCLGEIKIENTPDKQRLLNVQFVYCMTAHGVRIGLR